LLLPAITVILLDIKTSVAGVTDERFQALDPLVRVLQSLAERYVIAMQALDLLDPALKEAGWRGDVQNGENRKNSILQAQETSPSDGMAVIPQFGVAADPSHVSGLATLGFSKLGWPAATLHNADANVSEGTTTVDMALTSLPPPPPPSHSLRALHSMN
jgi:hypothetical protein